MPVTNGQLANQTTFNSAFMSRTDPETQTVAKVKLENPDVVSGPYIANIQRALNKCFEGLGATGEADANVNNYANNNYIVDSDSRKTAIEKLDAQLFQTQTDLDADEIILADHASRLNVIENLPSTFNGDKIFSGDVIVQGDFTVQGTQTIVNSTDMQVVDQNILVNKDGNDASAEGAGVDVKRTTTNAALRFDSSLASMWKIGLVTALYEILVSGPAQVIQGLKTFADGILTDTIGEETLNAGVTVDGVLIKDGLVDGRDVSADGAYLDTVPSLLSAKTDVNNKSESIGAGGNFTQPTKYLENYSVQSTGGAVSSSTTPLGAVAPTWDGAEITFIGLSNANPVSIVGSDIPKGILMNGTEVTLYRGSTFKVKWNAGLDRYVDVSRNQFGV